MHDALETLERIGTPRVLVVGDLMLDRYVWGAARRISPEAPVPILRSDRHEARLGGAAAVAYLLRGLEAQVTLSGVIGNDADGKALVALLDISAIDRSLVIEDSSRLTASKERIIGHTANRCAHQIVRVDRAQSRPLSEDLSNRLLTAITRRVPEHDVVLVADYRKGACSRRLLISLIAEAANHGVPVLVDPARGADYGRYRGATLLKPNRIEAQVASGVVIRRAEDALTAGRLLRQQSRVESVVITLDAEGMALVPAGGKGKLLLTRPRDVHDVTGAGDMVLVMLGLCRAAGARLDDAACLANVAAGLEVERFGIAAVTRAEIERELGNWEQSPNGGPSDKVAAALRDVGSVAAAPINGEQSNGERTVRERPASLPRSVGATAACLHLGRRTGIRDCPSCKGHVRQKVFACNHPDHTETTLDDCKRCPDFVAAAEVASSFAPRKNALSLSERRQDALSRTDRRQHADIANGSPAEANGEAKARPLATAVADAPDGPAKQVAARPAEFTSAVVPAITEEPPVRRFADRLRTDAGFVAIGPQSFGRAGRPAKSAARAAMTARQLILQSFQSPGDIVMLTAAVRDLHLAYPGRFETDVRTSVPALWENNPHITPLDAAAPGVELLEMHYDLINQCNTLPYHFVHGYVQHLERQLGLSIPVTSFQGDIHLSEDEKGWMSQVEELGFQSDFWIVMAGGKYDFTAKWWNPANFQKVVDHFRGRIQFVQCGEAGHFHPPLEGVINLVGKTDIRQFIRLMHHAVGVLCPVTFAMHLAAAVETKTGRPPHRPCVVIAGGREPPHWEAYPHHQFMSTVGALPCCAHGGCWRSRCQAVGDGDAKDSALCERPVQVSPELQIPQCMEMITREDVIRRIELYYEGESLAYLDEQRRPD